MSAVSRPWRQWLEAALAESRAVGYSYVDGALRGLAVLCAEEGDVATAAGQFLDVLDRFICDGFLAERWTTVAAGVPLLVKAGRREAAAVLLMGSSKRWRSSLAGQCTGPEEAADELATELTSSQLTFVQRRRAPISCSRWHARMAAGSRQRADRTGRTESSPGRLARSPAAAVQSAELALVGTLWRASYAGTTVHLPDSKGVRDLAVLLAQPGREVAALDLAVPATVGRPGPALEATEDTGGADTRRSRRAD